MLGELLKARRELNEVGRLLRDRGVEVEVYSRGVSILRIGRGCGSLSMGLLGLENLDVTDKVRLVQTLGEIRS
jgi:hypothetical protein